MKLISLNIELNRHHDLVIPFLKQENPDVICLQEVLEEDFEMYKKELGLEGVFQLWRYSSFSVYPELKGKKLGNAIFAKNIVSSGYNFYLGKEENHLKTFEEWELKHDEYKKDKVLVWINTKSEDGTLYKFVTTHFTLTKEGEATEQQLKDLNPFFKVLDTLGEFALCGDMNAPRGNETFTRLATKYKDNIPPEYITSLDKNIHRNGKIVFMVDGLFTTPSYKAENVKLVDGVSDHMAIVADITKI